MTHNPKHKCAVNTCGIYISTGMLMCVTHWRRVPVALRVEIRSHCASMDQIVDPKPTAEYLAAVEKAKLAAGV